MTFARAASRGSVALAAVAVSVASPGSAAAQEPAATPQSGAEVAPEWASLDWASLADSLVAAEWRPLRAADGTRLPDAPWQPRFAASSARIAALRRALRQGRAAPEAAGEPRSTEAQSGEPPTEEPAAEPRPPEPVLAEWTLHRSGGEPVVLQVLAVGDGVVRCRRGETRITFRLDAAAIFGDLEPAREPALRSRLVRTAAELQAAVAGEVETIVVADGSDLVLAGAVVATGRERLWIRAERPGRPVTIRVADPKAYVFEFVDCGRVCLQDVRLAHVDPPGRCDQGVVAALRTQELRLSGADLHGSGTHGIEANDTGRVLLIDTTIRDCSWRVAQVRRAREFLALRCSFLRSRSPAAPSFLLIGGTASFVDCTFADLGLGDHPLVDARSTALTFAGGAIDRLPAAAAPPVPWLPPPR